MNVSPILRYISNFFSRDIIFIKATETVTFFPSFFFIRGNFIIYQTKIIHTDNNINPILFSLNNCKYIYIHHLYTNFQKFLHKSISINVWIRNNHFFSIVSIESIERGLKFLFRENSGSDITRRGREGELNSGAPSLQRGAYDNARFV